MNRRTLIRRWVVVTAALLHLTASFVSFAQRNEDRRPGGAIQQGVSFELVTLPGPDSLRTRVDVFYRVDRAFFVAVRNQDRSSPFDFVRRGEISIDRSAQEGIPMGRSVHRVEMGEDDPEPNPTGVRQWYTGAFSFEMPPGPSTFRFQLEDLESKRSFSDGPRTIEIPRYRNESPSDPYFVTRGADSLTLVPMNYGGDLLYGSPAEILLALRAPARDTMDVHYRFTVREPEGSGTVLLEDSARDYRPLRGYRLAVRGDSGRAEYHLVPDSTSGTAFLIVPFAAQTLPLRPYTLSFWLRDGDRHRELPKTFRMVWPDMPYSLRDVDYALSSLRHIVTPSELDSLRSGDFERERDNLERFWEAKDPTPGTRFNEVMAEYYRRVDHAIRAFATLKQPDGTRSDRGKIYILYGQPTSIDRTLDPASGREVWTYSRLNKKFTFLDAAKSGTYVLVSTEPL